MFNSLLMAAGTLPEVPETRNWLEKMTDKLKLEGWLGSIGLTVAEALKMTYFFAGGFAIGFIFKKYFKFILGCLLVFTGITLILQAQNIITIDWVALKSFMGMNTQVTDVNSVGNDIVTWLKANIAVSISAALGFIFGYKLG